MTEGRSIRRQLPLLLTGVLVIAVTIVAAASYVAVRTQTFATVNQELQRVAAEVAAGFDSADVRNQLERVTAAANSGAAIAAVSADAGPVPDSLRAVLGAAVGEGADTIPAGLWSADGQLVAESLPGRLEALGGAPPVVGDTAALGPLRSVADTVVYYDVAAPVRSGGRVVGTLSVRRRLRSSTSDAMRLIIGPSAGLFLVNPGGGLWTDGLVSVSAGPTRVLSSSGLVPYERAGAERLGVVAPLPASPWLEVVEIGRAEALAPVSTFLLRLVLISLALLALGGGVAWGLGRWLTAPLEELSDGLAHLTAGDLSARVSVHGPLEIVQVGSAVNAMASRVESQLERLALLDEITRAIALRHDLQSILQVVVRSLEDSLPLDFACVLAYDATRDDLTVASVGVRSTGLAGEGVGRRGAVIAIDENGLRRCVRGNVVCEPDVAEARFPFPERLAGMGLRSLAMAPLVAESTVSGVLVGARREPDAFTSGDCEFLRQVGEHVGLASQQAELYDALETAYNDLRQTRQTVLREERLRALGQMASGIAHDINNSLSPVSLYAESMRETEPGLSERGREYLQAISLAVGDVARTVARMREFYRPREERAGVEPADLNTIVGQVVELTRARWQDMAQKEGADITVTTDLAEDLPEVLGMDNEIREALANLVLNAVDAMPSGGRLGLATRFVAAGTGPGVVEVEVSDTGAGMDEDARERCLEPFFTTKGERGTGLGLPMVFGMAKRHGADMEIDSHVGQGTTVCLRFQAAGHDETRPETPLEQPAPVPRMRLLLIDDDPILLRSLRQTLETDGHTVVTAAGGEEGIAKFRAAMGRPDHYLAVVTDLGMPSVDGRRVAGTVKRLSPETPVVMLTGWGRPLESGDDRPANVDVLLPKPPRLNEVRDALSRVHAIRAGA